MLPELFLIGPSALHPYGLFVALSFFAGLMVSLRIGKQAGYTAQHVLYMGFIKILPAIVGSRRLCLFGVSHAGQLI